MKILIVYDSAFGNTEKIVHAISDSLGSHENIKTFRVNDINPSQLVGLDLLIVGSPTRAFRPTTDIIGFLNEMPSSSLEGIKVAAFDTRYSVANAKVLFSNLFSRQFGYAAESIADKLVYKGGKLIVPPIGFIIKNAEGTLKAGELGRAAEWAKLIINQINV